MNGLGCGCQDVSVRKMRGLGAFGAAGPVNDAKPDIIAGAIAFTAPLAYEYGAPKKWKRLNWWQNVGAVVGIYFIARFAYNKVTEVRT